MGFVSTVFISVALWNVHQNTTASADCRDNLEVGADFSRAGGHVAQPVSVGVEGLGIEAVPVVENFETKTRAGWEKGDDEGRGMGVTKAVGHGLLGNVQQLSRLGGGQPVGGYGVYLQLKLSWVVAVG